MLRLPCLLLLLGAAASPARAEEPARYPPPTYAEREDRSLRDAVDFGLLLGYDLWSVVKEPFVMDRRSWVKVAAAGATFAVLFYYDEEIYDAVQRNRGKGLLGVAEDVGNFFEPLGLMGETGIYYAGGIAAGYAFRWERLERVSTDILFCHWTAGLLRQGFFRIVERSRPIEGQGPYNWGEGGSSLPSGHASTVMQLATVVSHHFPEWYVKTVAYGIAGTVVLQRVTSSQHWPSDAFLGAALGHAVGRIVVQANDRRGYLVVPTVDPQEGSLGMAVRWSF